MIGGGKNLRRPWQSPRSSPPEERHEADTEAAVGTDASRGMRACSAAHSISAPTIAIHQSEDVAGKSQCCQPLPTAATCTAFAASPA